MPASTLQEERIFQARRLFHDRWVPRYYSGALHLSSVFFLLLGLSAWSFLQIKIASANYLVWGLFFFLFNSFFVYTLHRFPQHKKYKGMGLFLKLHGIHHSVFNGKNFRLGSAKDIGMVIFPFSVVVAYCLFLFFPLSLLFAKMATPGVGYLFFAMACLYFLLHECVHYIDHGFLPATLKTWPPFKSMAEHHRKHHSHEYPACNFGVVIPFWDYIFRTKQ